MITVLGSLINIIGGTYITSTRIITLIMNKIFMNMSSKNYEKSGYGLDMDLAHHLVLIACFTCHEK